jgi:membrane-bound lytic murein transglycosylase B
MVRIVRAGTTARRVAAAVPVIALATAGIAFAATRGSDQTTAPTSITVPDTAITQGSPTYPQAGPAPAPMQLPPIYQTFTQDYARVDVPSEARAAITAIGSFAPVRLDANGIPSVAVAAYQRAAGVLSGIKPGCGIDWALLGAIGRVESNHARFGGNVLDASGIARPGIIGIPLDGSRGTARITDTDGGALDRDTTYDRAVGPMQFIPTSWSMAGRDGDGEGFEVLDGAGDGFAEELGVGRALGEAVERGAGEPAYAKPEPSGVADPVPEAGRAAGRAFMGTTVTPRR